MKQSFGPEDHAIFTKLPPGPHDDVDESPKKVVPPDATHAYVEGGINGESDALYEYMLKLDLIGNHQAVQTLLNTPVTPGDWQRITFFTIVEELH